MLRVGQMSALWNVAQETNLTFNLVGLFRGRWGLVGGRGAPRVRRMQQHSLAKRGMQLTRTRARKHAPANR